jgi:hypothetical protein
VRQQLFCIIIVAGGKRNYILTRKHGKRQLNILFIIVTNLKPDMPDALYQVSGFSIIGKDSTNKSAGREKEEWILREII